MSFLDDIAGNKKIASPKPKPKTEQKKTPENSINKKAEILGIGTGLKKNNITVSDKHLKELKRLSKKTRRSDEFYFGAYFKLCF